MSEKDAVVIVGGARRRWAASKAISRASARPSSVDAFLAERRREAALEQAEVDRGLDGPRGRC